MISLDNLTVSYGGWTLFDDISFLINPRDRIGLVGKNGAGKTTLLRLIVGEQQPTSGAVTVNGECSIGYLPQQMKVADTTTLVEETAKAFHEVLLLEAEIGRLTTEIAERTDYESPAYEQLLHRLNDAQDQYHILGGETRDADIEKTLLGLGFRREDFGRATSEFSGGWRMRIELAKLLLRRPSIFLLDEPTNHLDIESIQWLEEYLRNYSGAVLLISHDRAFLDNVTNRTVELSLGKVYDYKVSYSKYVELRAERRAQQLAAYENQQRMIGKTEEFIEKFRYKPTKSNQVQSRIKQLEKIERIEIEEEDLAALNIKFPPAPRSGQIVAEIREAGMSFGAKHVFGGADFVIGKGDKVAFVGRNGEGKTTLAKMIVGLLQPTEGDIRIGANVNIGYYAQNQEDLMNGELTVYDTLDRVAVGDIRTRLRDILGAFLFRGEDIDKKVKVLSGGERSRLALASLMLEPHNLLVLDEPTNHMDMRSKDILKSAVMKYDGTVIVVSHDREFLDGMVQKVYEFRDGGVREYLGIFLNVT
ncbi:ribosomal protection-like ABC-F family protein, partial [uncultured Alistipes sp.]|uniref:ribosomal protection-like ABC-F family protein n=1 Tax=uncultured Alistipes sp. TaxID=538949 RepID=UPI00272CDA56